MKIIIIYMSKHGATEKCAYQLAIELSEFDVTLCNMKNAKVPDLELFDQVIIGASIHAGVVPPKLEKWCKRNLMELCNHHLGLFLCCMKEGQEAIEQFENAFQESLRNHAAAKGIFGGEYNFQRMNFVERYLVRKISGETNSRSAINNYAISSFVEDFAIH